MDKRLLIWNVALSLLVVVGFSVGFVVQNNFNKLTDENVQVLNGNLKAMNKVISDQAEVINAQAGVIDEHARLMNGEYLTAIEVNQETMNEMAELIDRYREIVNKNAIYFADMQENLKELSLVVTQ